MMQNMNGARAIKVSVGLRAQRANGGTLSCVEHPELNARGVDHLRHLTAERIDLADEMTLRNSADRRIAGHLADTLQIARDHQGGLHPSARPQGRPQFPRAPHRP